MSAGRKKKIRTDTLGNGEPLLEIEDAWHQLEDVPEETNGANVGLAWKYLENDRSSLKPPPHELGLPDLISNMKLKLPEFQGKLNRVTSIQNHQLRLGMRHMQVDQT